LVQNVEVAVRSGPAAALTESVHMAKQGGGGAARRVSKRKDIEKQWRKGTGRWRYAGDSDHDTVHHRLSAPREVQGAGSGIECDALVVQTGGPSIMLHDGTAALRARPRRTTTTENPGVTLAAIGDRVRFTRTSHGDAVITHVYQRASQLLRSSVRAREYGQIIVANIDRIVIVTAATAEHLRTGLIDRYLVAAAMGGLDTAICINKMDLPDAEGLEFVRAIALMYRGIGYEVIETSCATGEGVAELRALIDGGLSAFSGHSGVGKTSLLNLLVPGLAEKTGDLSGQNRRGVHTTTRSTLYPLPGGGHIADTPGIREFGLHQFDPRDLHTYFPDFLAHSIQCRFPFCTHVHEPDCAVRAAVEREDVHPLRYHSYLQILGSEADDERA
jgi:ribosome biogenesis GTPase / thiamine phosphate phosphatase